MGEVVEWGGGERGGDIEVGPRAMGVEKEGGERRGKE